MARPSKSKWCNLDCFNCQYEDCFAPNTLRKSRWECECLVNVGFTRSNNNGKGKKAKANV